MCYRDEACPDARLLSAALTGALFLVGSAAPDG